MSWAWPECEIIWAIYNPNPVGYECANSQTMSARLAEPLTNSPESPMPKQTWAGPGSGDTLPSSTGSEANLLKLQIWLAILYRQTFPPANSNAAVFRGAVVDISPFFGATEFNPLLRISWRGCGVHMSHLPMAGDAKRASLAAQS